MKYLSICLIFLISCSSEFKKKEEIIVVEYHRDTLMMAADKILNTIMHSKKHHSRNAISLDSLQSLLKTVRVEDSRIVQDLQRSLECAKREADSIKGSHPYYDPFMYGEGAEPIYLDTIIYNKIYKDTIIYNFIKHDSVIYDTITYFDTIKFKLKKNGKFKKIN